MLPKRLIFCLAAPFLLAAQPEAHAFTKITANIDLPFKAGSSEVDEIGEHRVGLFINDLREKGICSFEGAVVVGVAKQGETDDSKLLQLALIRASNVRNLLASTGVTRDKIAIEGKRSPPYPALQPGSAPYVMIEFVGLKRVCAPNDGLLINIAH